MTRFARAKGSKSSNEKKPEEATSWCELKKAMTLKNSKKTETVTVEQKEKNVKNLKVVDKQENLKWSSLKDDEFDKSISLIRHNLSKKRKISDLSSSDVKVNDSQIREKQKINKSVSKKKKKILESSSLEHKNTENHLHKEKSEGSKKRNAEEINSNVSVKKKKKVTEKNEIDSAHWGEKKDCEKFQATKKIKKFKNLNFEKNSSVEHKSKANRKFKKFNKNFDKQNPKAQDSLVDEIIVNGEKILIVKFQGFNVTLEDAERLKKLRNDLLKAGVPKNKLEAAIKLERRRAEKALSRLKKAVCFLCRGHGHLLSNCPNLEEKHDTSTGICYKCGSTEHTAIECKVVRGTSFQFAECFICKEQGHIARQCPDNPRGLYPNGGACRECGDVTHLRKDCPKVLSQKAEKEITIGIRDDRDLECLDEEIVSKQGKKKNVKKKSTITF